MRPHTLTTIRWTAIALPIAISLAGCAISAWLYTTGTNPDWTLNLTIAFGELVLVAGIFAGTAAIRDHIHLTQRTPEALTRIEQRAWRTLFRVHNLAATVGEWEAQLAEMVEALNDIKLIGDEYNRTLPPAVSEAVDAGYRALEEARAIVSFGSHMGVTAKTQAALDKGDIILQEIYFAARDARHDLQPTP